MPVKNLLGKDVIGANKFTFSVDNDDLLVVSVSGLDETLQVIEFPDGTAASGGRTDPSETTVVVAQHTKASITFFDAWWEMCKDPVPPSAYKNATVTGNSSSGNESATTTMISVFIKSRKGADYSLEDGTTMTVVEYTLSVDDAFHS